MRRIFQVWFFIGVLLSLYGFMLTAAGVYQWTHLPATVLAGTHSTFWAGVILLIVGGIYTVTYWPRLVPEAPPNAQKWSKP